MKPLTDSKPKAMVLLKDKPLLEWHLESLAEAGVSEIAVVVGYLHQQIEEFFGKNFHEIPITYIEQNEQLGTAHAVSLAEKFAGKENFLVGQADVIMESYFIREFFYFAEKNKKRFDAVVAARKVSDVSKFGRIIEEKGIVKKIIEKSGEKKPGLINAGLWWFSPKIFSEIKKTKKSPRGEFEITDSAKLFIEKNRLGCFPLEGDCFDIGTIEELEKAEKEF